LWGQWFLCNGDNHRMKSQDKPYFLKFGIRLRMGLEIFLTTMYTEDDD